MRQLKSIVPALVIPIWLCACQGRSDQEGPPPPPIPARPHRISLIKLGGETELEDIPAGSLKEGMRLFQFEEGDYFTLKIVDLGGELDALPGLLEASIHDGADLIAITHPLALRAALAHGVRRPLVFGLLADPLALGVGTSDERHLPGLTGSYHPFHIYKLLALVRYYLPEAKRAGVVFNGRDPLSVAHKEAMVKEAARVQLEVVAEDSEGGGRLPAAIERLLEGSPDAICLAVGLGASNAVVIDRAREAKVPVFGFSASQVRAGALAAEVPDVERVGIEAGRLIYLVLSGEKPEALPLRRVIDTTTFVNPKIAEDLTITLPAGALRNARTVGAPPVPRN